MDSNDLLPKLNDEEQQILASVSSVFDAVPAISDGQKKAAVLVALADLRLGRNALLKLLFIICRHTTIKKFNDTIKMAVNHRLLNSACIEKLFFQIESPQFTASRVVSEALLLSKYATKKMIDRVFDLEDDLTNHLERLIKLALTHRLCSAEQARPFLESVVYAEQAAQNPNLTEDELHQEFAKSNPHVLKNINCPAALSRQHFDKFYVKPKDIREKMRYSFDMSLLQTKQFPPEILDRLIKASHEIADKVIRLPNYSLTKQDYYKYPKAVLANPNCSLDHLFSTLLASTSNYDDLAVIMCNPKANQKMLLVAINVPDQQVQALAKLHPNAPRYLQQL